MNYLIALFAFQAHIFENTSANPELLRHDSELCGLGGIEVCGFFFPGFHPGLLMFNPFGVGGCVYFTSQPILPSVIHVQPLWSYSEMLEHILPAIGIQKFQ
jgi:hypothetical protein